MTNFQLSEEEMTYFINYLEENVNDLGDYMKKSMKK